MLCGDGWDELFCGWSYHQTFSVQGRPFHANGNQKFVDTSLTLWRQTILKKLLVLSSKMSFCTVPASLMIIVLHDLHAFSKNRTWYTVLLRSLRVLRGSKTLVTKSGGGRDFLWRRFCTGDSLYGVDWKLYAFNNLWALRYVMRYQNARLRPEVSCQRESGCVVPLGEGCGIAMTSSWQFLSVLGVRTSTQRFRCTRTRSHCV